MAKLPETITVQLDPEIMELIRDLRNTVDLYVAHTENLIERVFILEGGDPGQEPTHHHQGPRMKENPDSLADWVGPVVGDVAPPRPRVRLAATPENPDSVPCSTYGCDGGVIRQMGRRDGEACQECAVADGPSAR
jgi:hypothetical protein